MKKHGGLSIALGLASSAMSAVGTPLQLHSRQSGAQSIDYNSSPPNLATLGNGTLFDTWRPKAHVLPPSGHTGDPTGHFVDAATGIFHVGYLWTSSDEALSGVASATTSDFVTYEDNRLPDPRYIEPGGLNDPIAVFDGTVIAEGYQGLPTFIYTSVSRLPISWTIAYTPGSETQSIAVSYDGGLNFTKLDRGPVIPSAPFGLNVTGWRDPFDFKDADFDRVTGSKSGTRYLLIAGGVHDVGPAQFLYRQYDDDLMQWEYLGRWWRESANSTWGDGTWAGRWGFNFEVSNVVRLNSEGAGADGSLFSLVCTEGGNYGVQGLREQQWAAGDVQIGKQSEKRDNDGKLSSGECLNSDRNLDFKLNMAGVLDAGASAYAAAGKLVPSTSQASQGSGAPDRYIVYLWLTGNFFASIDFPVAQQGWDSTLLTPRELFVRTISDVIDNDAVRETGSWRVVSSDLSAGTVNLETLGQAPVREAISAYKESATRQITEPGVTLSGLVNTSTVPFTDSPESRYFVLEASIKFPDEARDADGVKAGFQIFGSDFERTNVYYQFSNDTLIVDRAQSTAVSATTEGIDTRNEHGKLRLFDVKDSESGQTRIESLDITMIVDNSIVEIFVNKRFVLSTAVLPWYDVSKMLSFFIEGPVGVEFSEVMIWEGLVDAWPARSQ